MSIVNQMLLQNYSQALNTIDALEAGQKKAIEDFKALKEGDLSVDDLVVTDNGWEFVPTPPVLEPGVNGQKKMDAVSSR